MSQTTAPATPATTAPTAARTTAATPALVNRLGAEALGTFWLVFGGVGSAVFAATFLTEDKTQLGIGFVGVSLAFGLTVMTMAYAVGHVSGGHFNPAVTIGLALAKRFDWKDAPAYIATQVVAGLLAAVAVMFIASGKPGFEVAGNLAANGFGDNSPGGYGLGAVFVAEVVLTAFFLFIILGATHHRAPVGFAPIAIGLGLTLVHLVLIPISNASVNPARSTAVAFFHGDGAPAQLWVFWVAPIVGAAIAGLTYAAITGVDRSDQDVAGVKH